MLSFNIIIRAGLSTKFQIKLLLSKKVERSENMQLDLIKYDFSIPYVPPSTPIKTEYQNAEEFKTDFVSEDDVAAELGPDYNPLCSQLTYEADIRNAKERILERRKKESIQSMIKKSSILFLLKYLYIFNFNITLASAFTRDIQGVAAEVRRESSDNVMEKAKQKKYLAVGKQDIKPDVEWTYYDNVRKLLLALTFSFVFHFYFTSIL